MADRLYTPSGVAVNNPADNLAGLVGKEVRLFNVEVTKDEYGSRKYNVRYEVFGELSIVDPNGQGEFLVTSKSADTAISNLNAQFHVGQYLWSEPGNPNEIYITDRKPRGLL